MNAPEPENETADRDVCATAGCGRPSALLYLGRPRCQECYEDDIADGEQMSETPNHEETDMSKAKKTRKSAAKSTKAPKVAKTKAAKSKAAKPAGEPKPKRISALDAAAQVLQAEARPMHCKELIETMAAQGLWTSPNGKTPEATLYAAILREINVKGAAARFRKVDRGQFEYAAA